MKTIRIALFLLLFYLAALAQSKTPGTTTSARVAADWRTPAEISDYRTTPRYDETFAYIRRLAQATPRQVKLQTFGKTGEGRDLVAVIVSKDGVFDPATLHRQNRPVVLIQNAIHAGEMDGKDACLALMRDILIGDGASGNDGRAQVGGTPGRRPGATQATSALIERAVLVILPIYNADGHERFGAFNRINQNGPEQMGWRTTALNLNLNRDYMKADAPETRAFLKLWNQWLPDFFVDNHVTDGADYQFDTTYMIDSGPDVNPALAQWINSTLKPHIKQSVDASGHLLAPYIWLADESDPTKGFTTSQDTPRFSTGYAVLQNRPGFLVEMHMLKDYRTRVTGNYEVMRALLEVINRDAEKLARINRDADATTVAAAKSCVAPGLRPGVSRGNETSSNGETGPAGEGTGATTGATTACNFPLKLEPTGKADPFLYKGYKFTREHSEISGDTWVQYSHEPMDATIPRQSELKITKTVTVPRAYIIPAQWTPVINVLQAHGLKLLHSTRPYEAEVEVYRCETPTWAQQPFEGHHMATWKVPNPCKLLKEKMLFPTGSIVVPMDQRAAKVAIHLLEPEGPDSFVTWGFFDTIFEQKEYGEGYVLEKLAREMIAKDPQLKAEFDQKVATDKDFAASPFKRLNWFYQRSPWWDKTLGLYPVARINSLEGVPVN